MTSATTPVFATGCGESSSLVEVKNRRRRLFGTAAGDPGRYPNAGEEHEEKPAAGRNRVKRYAHEVMPKGPVETAALWRREPEMIFASRDAKEGVEAFRQKRKAKFLGV